MRVYADIRYFIYRIILLCCCDTLWQVSGLVTALPQQAKNESPAQHQHAMTAKSLLQGVYTQFAM